MEALTLKDWLVIAGAGLILLVLLDAVRRIWSDRRTEMRLNARSGPSGEVEDGEDTFNLLAELPNGGARIVARDDLQPAATPLGEHELAPAAPIAVSDGDSASRIEPDMATADTSSALLETAEPVALDQESVIPPSHEETHDGPEEAAASQGADPEKEKANRRRTRRRSSADPDAPETLDWLEELDTGRSAVAAEAEAKLPRAVDPHVFVLNVVARATEGFSGGDLLQILLACDLRFGDMDFFHRHESASGRGPIQFSVANMMNPGVFDIDTMDELRTRGLMFFVTLPGPSDMLQAFDYMYETAKTVARNLDGDVLDDTRSAITRQSLDHMRQQIRELDRRLRLERDL